MKLLQNFLPLAVSALALFSVNVEARSQAPSAIRHISILDNPVINTPSHEIHHLTHFDITFNVHDKHRQIKLELEPNHNILADDAYVQYLDAEGNVHREEAIQRHDHKVFKGRTLLGRGNGMWDPVGWARIYVKRDGSTPLFEGAFSINNDNHHVELKSTYLEKKRAQDIDIPDRKENYMIVYRDSDMIRPIHSELKRSLTGSSSCQADELSFHNDLHHPIFHADFQEPDMSSWGTMSLNSLFGLSKRQTSDIGPVSGNTGGVNLQQSIGSTAGCPNIKQVALIGIAGDCSLWDSFNGSTADAKSWIISTVNSASEVYEKSFNISIGLRNLTLVDTSCPETALAATPWNIPCSQGNITSRLNLFSQWRGQQSDTNAYWTLMSDCATDSEVGLSWLGQLCNSQASSDGTNTVSGTNVVVRTGGTGWQVFAHETGHTFGAVHDCEAETCAQDLEATSQCCPLSTTTCNANGAYIMNPTTGGTDVTQFSPCTIGNICSALGQNSVKSTCLSDNRDVVTYTGSQCGNGIVEEGEECDCGGTEACGGDTCCDATTCKFKNGAVCDDANDSCCSACQFTAAGTVCRASRGECDPQETCSGNSSSCPADVFEPNGKSCGSGLTCASGQCTSRDAQCQSVMGSLLNSSSDTYACTSYNFSTSCQFICTSPAVGDCYSLNQNYLDGTPCGSGGSCSNGQCNGSNSTLEWIKEHKTFVIPLACGVGVLLILSILWYLTNRCRRARPVAVKRPPMQPPYGPLQYGPPQPGGAWSGPMPPPQGQWATGSHRGYHGIATEDPPPYAGFTPAPRYA